MQTFLPVQDLWGSATLLDRGRLGKQRSETMQIMEALTGIRVNKETLELEHFEPKPSIAKHWVTSMWRGHEYWLLCYQGAVTSEWEARGYRDTCWDKTHRVYKASGLESAAEPEWWHDPEVFKQHRDRLFTKDPITYSELFPDAVQREDYDFKWRK